MQKNLYYRTLLRRDNLLKKFLLDFFHFFTSYFRLLLEVFTRKNFGERYFQLSSAITVTVVLAVIPFIPKLFTRNDQNFSMVGHYLTWYIFLGLFLLMSIRHYKDMRRNPSVFDFARFSLSSGTINTFFFTIKFPGRKTDLRMVETLFEPALFFILGIFLWLFQQRIGILLTIASLGYALNYMAAYNEGDHFVMDKIDEIISNEELKRSFVDDAPSEQTRGFRFVGHKPDDLELRRKILPLLTDNEEVNIAR